MTKCTSVVLIEHLNKDDDLLEITIDDMVKSYMVAKYGDILKYIDQDVIVTYRKDIYKGMLCQFIDTVTVPTRVATLDREDNVKLYVEQEDNFSNVCFADLQEGETKLNAEMYCVSHTYNSSPNAVWAELVVRDKSMRLAKIRLFDYDYNKYNYSGRYIRADIQKSKYGLTSKYIEPLEENSSVNPEVAIARQYVLSVFKEDEEIMNAITENNLLDCIADVIDLEKGYALVRVAQELALACELSNITNSVDVELIKRVILLSYSYALSPTSSYSKKFCSMVSVSKMKLSDKQRIMLLLDDGNDAELKERYVIEDIRKTVDTIVSIKKGLL